MSETEDRKPASTSPADINPAEINDGTRVFFNQTRDPAPSGTTPALTPDEAAQSAASSATTSSGKATNPAKTAKPHYHGHRQRLRERFVKGGPTALADYELLELMLCMAMPRGDVKPLAKALIAQFGSFANVLSARAEDLQTAKGLGEAGIAAIKIAEASAQHLSRERAMELPVIASWEQLIDYCRVRIGHLKTEELHLLFLDRKNRLIADECHQRGTVDHTPVYPREVIKRALELHASAIILVHNHPSGDATPSKGDIEMTRKIIDAAKAMDMSVHDHIIISQAGYNSFKSLGLI
ncbi:MAG: DNA repair protein RadC [Thalassospira sp.]|uniref:RadC family protein n=1 Tax=Thalassospira sp. TaxID=1912094 RepID=UPI0032F00329